ncbi:hypothetical protein BH10PAT4_BH10PAT4_4810 [soil metagenome]
MAQDNKSQQSNANGVAFGITSLTTGIVAFLSGWIFFLSIPIGIVAIVFGALGIKKPASRGMAIAGMVTGIVGVAFGIGILALALMGSINTGAPQVPMHSDSFFYHY